MPITIQVRNALSSSSGETMWGVRSISSTASRMCSQNRCGARGFKRLSSQEEINIKTHVERMFSQSLNPCSKKEWCQMHSQPGGLATLKVSRLQRTQLWSLRSSYRQSTIARMIKLKHIMHRKLKGCWLFTSWGTHSRLGQMPLNISRYKEKQVYFAQMRIMQPAKIKR